MPSSCTYSSLTMWWPTKYVLDFQLAPVHAHKMLLLSSLKHHSHLLSLLFIFHSIYPTPVPHVGPLSPEVCGAVQGDAFGCPYVTLAPAELAEQLQALRLPSETVRDAVAKSKGKHYQLACMAVFEGQHTCICDSGINHPNQVRAQDTFLSWRTALSWSQEGLWIISL